MYQDHSLEVLAIPGQPSTVRAPGYQPCHKTVPVLARPQCLFRLAGRAPTSPRAARALCPDRATRPA